MNRLKDQVAIVTGASRGIGQAIALRFAQEGARVVVCSRKPDGVAQAEATLNAAVPDSTWGIPCHVGKEDDLTALFEAVQARWGTPTVLVNNAGTNPYFGPMLGAEWSAWDKTFEVNLKGPFAATRLFAQHQLDAGCPGGSVICTSSILGLRAAPHQGLYGMTKAALISMVKTLALELAPAKIRVNAIAPGFVDTRLSSAIQDSPELRRQVLAHTPQNRVATPDEIAGVAAFLASDDASFTTGQCLVADGGYTIL